MKKILLFFVVAFICILGAKANDLPFSNYVMNVQNQSGAKKFSVNVNMDAEGGNYVNRFTLNGEAGRVEYNTEIQVDYEFEYNNENYLVYYDENDSAYYAIRTKDFDFTSKYENYIHHNDDEYEYLVVDNYAYLYNGPSYLFGKVSGKYKLPKNAKIKVKYYNGLFAYVEYKKHKGWVYVYQDSKLSPYGEPSSVLRLNNKNKIDVEFKLLEDAKMYSSIVKRKDVIKTIPKKTKLKASYAYTVGNLTYYYVEYKGDSGWILIENGTAEFKNQIDFMVVLNNDKLHYELKNGKASGDDIDVPAGSRLSVVSNGLIDPNSNIPYFIKAKYGDESGYMSFEDVENDEINVAFAIKNQEEAFKSLQNVNVFDIPGGNVINSFNVGEVAQYLNVGPEWTYIYKINDDETRFGWVHSSNLNTEDVISFDNEDILDTDENIKNDDKNKTSKMKVFILYSLIALLVIVISAGFFVIKERRKKLV